MKRIGLVEALGMALQAQRAGTGAAVVHIVANRSGSALDLGARMLAQENGAPRGSLHPTIDGAAAEAARNALESRRSRLYSLAPSEHGGEVVGMQGGGVDVFVEVLAPPPRLVIVGAGHIAQPLCLMGKLLDFHVTVIDDRPEFANRERFPEADAIRAEPFAAALAATSLTQDTYAVLVTRGHVHDQACLELLLPSAVRYIGMIGSKRRVRTCLRMLEERGFGAADLARVYAPIGLDIGAHTPAEIALAIAAEIVDVMRKGSARHLRLRESARV